MVSKETRKLGRAFAKSFGPLGVLLTLEDYLYSSIYALYSLLKASVKKLFSLGVHLVDSVYNVLFNRNDTARYELLDDGRRLVVPGAEPELHRHGIYRRMLTYYGGILLGSILFIFVYYVLVKHHTIISIVIAALLFLVYLVILENSHTLRSILMLSVPLMFTNRGRALIFCSMIAIMLYYPAKNAQTNIAELHVSITCCKQYLIVKSDTFIEDKVINNIVKVEDVIYQIIGNLKEFAEQLQEKFKHLLYLALTVNRYIELCVQRMKEILEICNSHGKDVKNNCQRSIEFAYKDCYSKLGETFGFICEVVDPLKHICLSGEIACKIPRAIYRFLDKSVGERLRLYVKIIKKQFYVDVDVHHNYSYNGTQSKNYSTVIKEIKTDMEDKFFYFRFIARVFNLISLVMVIWITISATMYHMHYLAEISYDNMYIDGYLENIDRKRRDMQGQSLKSSTKESQPLIRAEDLEPDEQIHRIKEDSFLFPMPKTQQSKYLRPFSWRMNENEMHKVLISGLIWFAIVAYVFFFVIVDYGLYKLMEVLYNVLQDILFSDELPLIEVSSKMGDQLVRYNRTYINQLRNSTKAKTRSFVYSNRTSSLSSMYRRVMDSIEKNIPDDVAILDSLRTCLPKPSQPNYFEYKVLAVLAAVTFGAVILEAYALRTRHCLANLYYPSRAKKRANWLYRKLMAEQSKYRNTERLEKDVDLERAMKLATSKG